MAIKATQVIGLDDKQKTSLRNLAVRFGLTIGRGPSPEMGSINQLVQGVADSKFLVVPNPQYQEQPEQ